MKRILIPTLALIATLLLSCSTAAPGPVRATDPDDRYLVDPRSGFAGALDGPTSRHFDEAWLAFQSGDDAAARSGFEQILVTQPRFLPARIGIAALDIRARHFDTASQVIAAALNASPGYTAARIYDAELAFRTGDLRRAYASYTQVSALPAANAERLSGIRQSLLADLLTQASRANTTEALPLLREALALDPHSRATQLLVVQNLLAQKDWDAARSALDPLIVTDADRTEVQEALAEIEIGHGQYEQAIARYERLARRERDPRFTRRLDEVKQQWNAANMPPQYLRAVESSQITRVDLAVLLYWKIASIRFAQNLQAPPIAVDLSDVPGRDEVVRALAMGVLQVDPITRRAAPLSTVSPAQLTRYTARVLTSRGATCAREGGSDPSKVLAACHVTDLTSTLPSDAAVTGAQASAIVDQVQHALGG